MISAVSILIGNHFLRPGLLLLILSPDGFSFWLRFLSFTRLLGQQSAVDAREDLPSPGSWLGGGSGRIMFGANPHQRPGCGTPRKGA